MSSKFSAKLRKISKRYTSGKATPEEKAIIERYYALFDEAPEVRSRMSADEEQAIGKEIFSRIQRYQAQLAPKPLYKRQWFGIAASFIVISMLVLIGLMLISKKGKIERQEVYTKAVAYPKTPYTRNLMLPDGSKIVLHGNSQINLAKAFSYGHTREVWLTGEAFFDVKHNALRPFIIHTGIIKTTVLGTAFTIKAYRGDKDIHVSVIRGKVKVESNSHVLAVLTPDKQLVTSFNQPVAEAKTTSVSTKQVLSWAAEGMSFDDMEFGKLAAFLEKRYGVSIVFKNSELANCRITGSFTGTENLEEVLTILSQTRGTTFHVTGTKVLIDGEGCQ